MSQWLALEEILPEQQGQCPENDDIPPLERGPGPETEHDRISQIDRINEVCFIGYSYITHRWYDQFISAFSLLEW